MSADLEPINCNTCSQQLATVPADRRPLAATGHPSDVHLTGGDCAIIWCAGCERWQGWAHITALDGDRRAAFSRAHWCNTVLSVVDAGLEVA